MFLVEFCTVRVLYFFPRHKPEQRRSSTMRKLFLCTVMLFSSSIAHAEVKQNRLFDCMDATSFEINSQCMEASIAQSTQFRDMQLNIAQRANNSDENVTATIKFYPKSMDIEIVAHRDALTDASLTASNTKF